MKLTGKLKEKVSKAETKEQAKELIANAGMELTDEEMDNVAGGRRRRDGDWGFKATRHADDTPMY